MDPLFLTTDDVLGFHRDLVRRYGGRPGVRDPGGLESALSQPMATFRGSYLHRDLFSMAAAYLFHLVRNHPFVDGNKRVGLYTALAFLEINGIEVLANPDEVAELVLRVARGEMGKERIAGSLREWAHS